MESTSVSTPPKPPSGVVAAIPRRTQVESHATVETLGGVRKESFRHGFRALAGRVMVWTYSLGLFAAKSAIDILLFRGSREVNARRLRETMQRMGPTAIKLGQQLSIRSDLLPTQYCNELRKLLDKLPPFSSEEAIQIIQEETGRPIGEIFSRFDPISIGSASIACVFQAYLLDGTRVAVKVRRPGIGDRMAADLRALSILFRVVEALSITRPGLSRLPMRELSRMLMDELDFKLEARYTEIFRKDSKSVKYLSAPKVYFEYSTSKVMISEFVSGVFLSEILRAVEAQDESTLSQLRVRGFNLKKISRRMMRVFFWEVFESHFFHADPHPANIIVQPDNTITMIDFGSCGEISRAYRRDLLNFYRHLQQADLNGVVRAMISSLEPLPPINIEAYSNDLLAIVRDSFIAIQSEHASWQEKCSGGMWMKLINLHRDYEISTRPDVLRFFRASFLYDSIIYRLNPQFDQIKEFRRWHKRWANQAREDIQKQMRKRVFGLTGHDYLQIEHILSLTEQGIERMGRFLSRPHYDYALRVNKFAYVVSLITKTTMQTALMVMVVVAARLFYTVFQKERLIQLSDLKTSMLWILGQPTFYLALCVMAGIATRKVLMRLDDVDVDQ
jgi:ubiquinone biosynthesis protein